MSAQQLVVSYASVVVSVQLKSLKQKKKFLESFLNVSNVTVKYQHIIIIPDRFQSSRHKILIYDI